MKVGWLADRPGVPGGAEMDADAFRAAAPSHVEVADCPPGEIVDADAYFVGNCVTYGSDIIPTLEDRPVFKRVADVWPHGDPALRDWLLSSATLMFTSPFHRAIFPSKTGEIVPPPIPVSRFREWNVKRQGTVWLGQMTGPHYGVAEAVSWAYDTKQHVDFYGPGRGPGGGPYHTYRGTVDYDDVPALLASYERFLFLPTAPQPCSREILFALCWV